MNDPDNFLSRWSRRKREAGEGKEKNETGEAVAAPAPENQQGKPAAPGAAPIPEFDVESLPPIETISAETDITAFMRTGVPETLKHAALRRAWSSDPVIRDFVGLNEKLLGRSRARWNSRLRGPRPQSRCPAHGLRAFR